MNRFLSFADSRMSAALERLGRQAEALDFFDEITLFTEHDLSAEFTSRMGRYLTPSCRGFGYWSWKPWVIHHVLQEMEEGDRLLYLDAGCHINANGTERFREYVNMLDRDSRGMLVFTNGQPEYKWTKGDIFRHFGVSKRGNLTHHELFSRPFPQLHPENSFPLRLPFPECNDGYLDKLFSFDQECFAFMKANIPPFQNSAPALSSADILPPLFTVMLSPESGFPPFIPE